MINNNVHILTVEQRILLMKIDTQIKHKWVSNLSRIIRFGSYTEQDKRLVLNPLRKKYIEHLRKQNYEILESNT